MTRIEQKLTLSDAKFKRRIGTTKPVFCGKMTNYQGYKEHNGA